MLFIGCILSFYKTSLMNGYKLKIVKNTNHCFGVNYLELFANILIRGTVIIFVLSHVYVIILSQLILFVILYLKWFIGQRLQGCLLYTSDAADDLTRVDLGGRRIIKK